MQVYVIAACAQGLVKQAYRKTLIRFVEGSIVMPVPNQNREAWVCPTLSFLRRLAAQSFLH